MGSDLLLVGARIVDGTGGPRRWGYVAVEGDTIAHVGEGRYPLSLRAEYTIDVDGCYLCPGFIDVHGHSDMAALADSALSHKVGQGVTTEVMGNCGMSLAPLAEDPSRRLVWRDYATYVLGDYELDWSWRSMGEFLTALERRAPAVNLACLVGHGAIRTAVMGFDNHAPSTAELAEIQHYADEAMAAGAFGVSTGLGYPPGAWADTDELIEVARIAGTHDGLYVTHMRNEAEELLESVRESLLVGERAGCPVQISHHKVAGRPNWGMVEQSLAMLGAAREAGRRVAVDVYPYTGGSGYLSALLPMEVWEGGLEAAWRRLQDDSFLRNLRMQVSGVDWTTITIRGVRSSKNREFIDLNMQQISGLMGRDPIESMVELLVQEQGAVLMTTFGTLSEQDVRRVIQSGLSMIGSDGLPARDARPHPRTYGAFTRFLATYALRQELLPFEKAVMKCTSYPARFFGLTGRGLISEGAKADLVVLDPGALDDGASIEEPRRRSPGVRHVIVNGVRVLEDGRLTGNRPGCVLRRQCPGSY